jgi:hypothetical protein
LVFSVLSVDCFTYFSSHHGQESEPTPPELRRVEPERGVPAPEEARERPVRELEREAVPGAEVSRPTKARSETTPAERTSFVQEVRTRLQQAIDPVRRLFDALAVRFAPEGEHPTHLGLSTDHEGRIVLHVNPEVSGRWQRVGAKAGNFVVFSGRVLFLPEIRRNPLPSASVGRDR